MRYYLIDLISEWEPDKKIRGIKNVAMTEDFLEYHFPKFPTMPGVLLIESMAQLAGWLEAVSSDFTRWFLIDHVHQCKFYGFARPGDQVEIEVKLLRSDGDNQKVFQGIGTVSGQKRVFAEFAGKIVPLSEIEHPADQSALFNILSRRAPQAESGGGAIFG
jgi:3-hydroxyacyl-[acyl-carrier-protein] dehydratase